jgi:hypothetical protein
MLSGAKAPRATQVVRWILRVDAVGHRQLLCARRELGERRRFRAVDRRVRAQMRAAYEGACTRYTREREVRYSGGRFRSKLLRRKRVGSGLLTAVY